MLNYDISNPSRICFEQHDFDSCNIEGGQISELSPYSGNMGFHSLFFKYLDSRGKREFLYIKGSGERIVNPENDDYWIGYCLYSFRQFTDEIGCPWLVIHGNAPQLRTTKLEKNHLEQIQQSGLAVFYFEPLYLCDEKERWPWIPNKSDRMTIPELDWLGEFLELNKISRNQIKIFVNDYKMNEFLKGFDQYKDLEVVTNDIFLHFQISNQEDDKLLDIYDEFDHRFVCLNFRYDGIRELIAAYLFQTGKAALTFFHQHDTHHMFSLLPFDPRRESYWEKLKKGIAEMQDRLPLTIDTSRSRAISADENAVPDLDGLSNQRPVSDDNFIRREAHRRSFVCIVNESRILTPCPQISEKTTDAIIYGRPFVLLAGPRALEYLRSLGFETFHKFWDESYDQELNHRKRIRKVLNVIDQISQMSEKAVLEMNEEMKPILKRNQELINFQFLDGQQDSLNKIYYKQS